MCSKGRFTGSWKMYWRGDSGGREASGGLEIRTWSAPTCVRVSEKKNDACRRKREKVEKTCRAPAGTHRSIDVVVQMRHWVLTKPARTCIWHFTSIDYGRRACPVIYFASCRHMTDSELFFRRLVLGSDERSRIGSIGWHSELSQRSLLYSSSGKLWAAA